jgi:hypothetical protein
LVPGCIQKIDGHIFLPARDDDSMSPLLEDPHGMLEKPDIGRVNNIKEDIHGEIAKAN